MSKRGMGRGLGCPLLANIYLDPLDQLMAAKGQTLGIRQPHAKTGKFSRVLWLQPPHQ